jgi:diphthine synthase
MLTLIGLGLNDEKDLTLRGVEEAKAAKKVYAEFYTSYWHGSLKKLEKIVGKKIVMLARKDLEEESKKIIEEAKKKKIVLLVQGGPLVATTHTMLIQEAKKNKIKVKIVHNASIISAVGETGLHLYKFGPTVTISFPEKTKGKLPESVYDVLLENKKRGLHTLCLLDVVAEEKKYMTAAEALKILLELENKRKEDVLNENSGVVVFSNTGGKKSSVVFGKVKNLMSKDFEKPMVLIILGILHFTEKEFLAPA